MTTSAEGPGSGSAVRHEVEGPKIADSLYEAFPNRPSPMGIDPKDGLPSPVIPAAVRDALAPDLDPDRFVCMEDASRFVIRDGGWGDITVEIGGAHVAHVERAPNGQWRIHADRLVEVMTTQIARYRAAHGFGPNVTDRTVLNVCTQTKGDWVAVEPIRPQCAHYARQLIPFPEDADHQLVARLCTARRTDEGEFLDVGNAQVFACELRSPPYGCERQKIDAFDERTVETARKRRLDIVNDDFDVDAALGAQASTDDDKGKTNGNGG